MNECDADVVIIGAGPAGSMAAYQIASSGFSVIVLEKQQFPRYKVCGGGLTHKIIKEIPFDLTPIIETKIFSIRFSCNFQDVFTRTASDALMYCTMRSDLDLFLIKKAEESGARFINPAKVKAIMEDGGNWIISTGEQQYICRIIIGADGASGIVSKTFNLNRNIEKGLAWEAEIEAKKEVLEKFNKTVFLDWGTFPGGYGWVFPKGDHFSVGVGGPATLSGQMKDYYVKFLRSCEIFPVPEVVNNPSEIPGTRSLKAWPIPVRVKKGAFHKHRVLITGDAGGLSDPLTGEGIYFAVRSGKLAGTAAISYLKGDDDAFIKYSDKINEELVTELIEAYKIKHIFNTIPLRIHHFVRDSDRAWKAFVKILRGERTYADVKKVFGKWHFAWNLASIIAGIYVTIKEWKFRKRGLRSL